MDLELVSFKLCPFVQRSVITLLHKQIPFRITYIDLDAPPEWFGTVSPLGKVPLLRVAADTVLFESAVINEYLDEITPPRLQPDDPLRRALNRSWIEFGSECLATQYRVMTAPDEATFGKRAAEMRANLERAEAALGPGPYFNGPRFSLVDAAYAPLFMRISLMEPLIEIDWLEGHPGLSAWSAALLSLDAVQRSVVDDFGELFSRFLKGTDSYAAARARERGNP